MRLPERARLEEETALKKDHSMATEKRRNPAQLWNN
jgi:hypothetical protein